MSTENAAVVNDSMDVELDSAWEDGEDGFEAEKAPETEPVTEEAAKEEKGAQESEKVENNPANQPETFTLKNKILGDRQVSKDEYDAFAQKGYDYDRVQQERDQLREYKKVADPAYTAMKEFAKRAGFGDNLSGFLDALREQELRQSGKTETEAKNIVEQEKREANLTARERQQKSIADFYAMYPNVKPEDIPKEVWDAVFQKGADLTNAYTMYENKRLAAELAAERKNKENKASAPGSLSANAVSEQDEIDRIWDEDE